MKFKQYLNLVGRDRDFIIPSLVALLVLGAIFVMGIIQIRPSDLQIPVRYTSFGITNFYRDKWYYELAFMVFALLLTVSHFIAGVRLYAMKGRSFAVSFMWLTVGILLISALTILAILRVVSFSQ